MNPVIVIAAIDGAIAVLKMVAELGAQAKRDSAWTAEQEAELAESIAEADRGDVITAAELLERLRP